MSKTTDALDWAYETGYRAAIAQLPVETPTSTSYSIPDPEKGDPEGYSLDLEAEFGETHPHANEPEGTGEAVSHESFAESYPDEVQFHYDGGWNAALLQARQELSMNLDTLIGIAQWAAEDEDADIRTALFEVIDQRVSELKR